MYLNDLADTLRAAGLDVVEVSGWQNRNHGAMTSVECVVVHHTATSNSSSGDYPSLAIVRDGRSDLAGPLAQLGVGRSGKVYVIANGVAYHAGATLYTYQNNQHSIGIEVESAGDGTPWPSAQVNAVVRTCAALCKRYDLTSLRVQGHKEVCSPVGRKVDPIGIPGDMSALRNSVKEYTEDDMFEASDRETLFALAYRIEALLNNRANVRSDALPESIRNEKVPFTDVIQALAWRQHSVDQMADKTAGGPTGIKDENLPLVKALKDISAKLDAISAKLNGGTA